MSGVELVENQIDEPKNNEILIKVKAASVNFPDLLMTQGNININLIFLSG